VLAELGPATFRPRRGVCEAAAAVADDVAAGALGEEGGQRAAAVGVLVGGPADAVAVLAEHAARVGGVRAAVVEPLEVGAHAAAARAAVGGRR
jgi:hypothetical protein